MSEETLINFAYGFVVFVPLVYTAIKFSEWMERWYR